MSARAGTSPLGVAAAPCMKTVSPKKEQNKIFV